MTWGLYHLAPTGPSLGLKPHSHLEKAPVVGGRRAGRGVPSGSAGPAVLEAASGGASPLASL